MCVVATIFYGFVSITGYLTHSHHVANGSGSVNVTNKHCVEEVLGSLGVISISVAVAVLLSFRLPHRKRKVVIYVCVMIYTLTLGLYLLYYECDTDEYIQIFKTTGSELAAFFDESDGPATCDTATLNGSKPVILHNITKGAEGYVQPEPVGFLLMQWARLFGFTHGSFAHLIGCWAALQIVVITNMVLARYMILIIVFGFAILLGMMGQYHDSLGDIDNALFVAAGCSDGLKVAVVSFYLQCTVTLLVAATSLLFVQITRERTEREIFFL